MSIDTRDFTTDSIDLASFLVAHGRNPSVCRTADKNLVTFTFRRDDAILLLIEEYVAGSALVCARVLLASRRRLFHAVRSLREGGGPRGED